MHILKRWITGLTCRWRGACVQVRWSGPRDRKCRKWFAIVSNPHQNQLSRLCLWIQTRNVLDARKHVIYNGKCFGFRKQWHRVSSVAPTRHESLCPVMLPVSWMLVEVCSRPVSVIQTGQWWMSRETGRIIAASSSCNRLQQEVNHLLGLYLDEYLCGHLSPPQIQGDCGSQKPEQQTQWCSVWRQEHFFFRDISQFIISIFYYFCLFVCCLGLVIMLPDLPSVRRLITSKVNDQQMAINKQEMWLMKCSCL